MRDYGIILDVSTNTFWIKDQPSIKYPMVFRLSSILVNSPHNSLNTKIIHIPFQERLKKLLDTFPDVASKDGKLGKTPYGVHEIETEGRPVSQRPYSYTPQMRKIINDEITKLLQLGIIRKSRSPYSSPVVMDKKPDGTYRMCINYIKLNLQMKI